MPTLYFAAPLFTDAERSWNAAQVAALRVAFPEMELLVPQEFCASLQDDNGDADFARIFAACRAHLDRATMVLAVLDGADADSGTAWELGYAYARQLPCIGLRSDWRPAEDGSANCMLSRSCESVYVSIAEIIAALRAS